MATVAIQDQSISAAMATMALTAILVTFDGRKLLRILGWCGINPTYERLLPNSLKKLKVETTKTGKRAVLTHLIDN